MDVVELEVFQEGISLDITISAIADEGSILGVVVDVIMVSGCFVVVHSTFFIGTNFVLLLSNGDQLEVEIVFAS